MNCERKTQKCEWLTIYAKQRELRVNAGWRTMSERWSNANMGKYNVSWTVPFWKYGVWWIYAMYMELFTNHVRKLVCPWLGCSTEKYFGEGYCVPCPPNCLSGQCEKMNGTCSGCIDGYVGFTCNKGNK